MVDKNEFGAAVFEDVCDLWGCKTGVDRTNHRTSGGDCLVRVRNHRTKREVHRLADGTGTGCGPGYERVWSENRDSILGLDTKVDESICEVLYPLGPGSQQSA